MAGTGLILSCMNIAWAYNLLASVRDIGVNIDSSSIVTNGKSPLKK